LIQTETEAETETKTKTVTGKFIPVAVAAVAAESSWWGASIVLGAESAAIMLMLIRFEGTYSNSKGASAVLSQWRRRRSVILVGVGFGVLAGSA